MPTDRSIGVLDFHLGFPACPTVSVSRRAGLAVPPSQQDRQLHQVAAAFEHRRRGRLHAMLARLNHSATMGRKLGGLRYL